MGTNIRKSSLEYSDEEYDKIQNVNIKSAFFACQLAHGLLKAAQKSSVVMIGSVAGGPQSIKSGSIYAMTKGMPAPGKAANSACSLSGSSLLDNLSP